MHEKMEKILSLFKKVDPDEESYYILEDTNDFQMFDCLDFVCVSMDVENFKRNKVSLSFYSSCSPDMSASIIKHLTKNKFNSFIITENIYRVFDEEGKFKEMFFGDEADQKYKEDIYTEFRDNYYKQLTIKNVENIFKKEYGEKIG